MAGTPTAADRVAASKYGPSVNAIAQRYRNPITGKPLSGTALLLKLASGESSFDSTANSGKAQGRTQFTPGSRAIAIRKYGVDPLASIDDAYHAAALHLRGKINGSTGLEGYNPGDPTYAGYILGQRVGKTSGARRARSGASGGSSGAAGAAGGGTVDPGPSASAAALLAALQGGRPQVMSSPPPAPAFSAAPVFPAQYGGGAALGGTGSAGGGPDLASLLQLIQTPAGGAQTSGAPAADGGAAPAAAARGPKLGKVSLSATANRPGTTVTPGILRIAEIVAGAYGKPLVVGTGTNHSQMSKSGLVSDHWEGNAVDIPAAGGELTSLGYTALVALGVPRSKAKQMAKQGGIFNVPYGKHRRIQVIFNTNSGGNHWNHLHLGVTALGGRAR